MDFPILFLSNAARGMRYTSPSNGGGTKPPPLRDRRAHADRLAAGFKAAWEDAENRRVAVQSSCRGVYLEFEGAPGHRLRLQSLENRQANISLMNVRTHGESDEAIERATVYVPLGKAAHFLDKFRAYKDKNTRQSSPDSEKPMNQQLVASIEDVRGAFLEAFWTDLPDKMPKEKQRWVEVWLAVDAASDRAKESLTEFRQTAAALDIPIGNETQVLKFPERWVSMIYANRAQLLALIDHADKISEFRAARETCSYFVNELENAKQTELVTELLGRATFNPDSNISICILDSGINSGHPMIMPALAAEDMHAVDPDWGTADDPRSGHGTAMAGIAIYGDVQAAIEGDSALLVPHRLESAKILPPWPSKNPQMLYGRITAQGIYLAEIQAHQRKRVVCMAVTTKDARDRGKPTSWSAALDQLASGSDDENADDNRTRRLILVSAGNINDQQEWASYPASNATNQIHDPGQSWNVLTIGAYTDRTLIKHRDYQGYTPIAPPGGLSPSSTTSVTWERNWPVKPDIVLEGGNYALSPGGKPAVIDDLRIMSLWHQINQAHFATFGDTSGATAHAANLAARIYAEYPDIWPETVRGLLVHSARWTQAMKDQFISGTRKRDYDKLRRTCGYGVPDLYVALRCLQNRLTLVSEAKLQPFAKRDDRYVTNELHLYELPWPMEELQQLGAVEVELRITLSYFIEPGPGEIGWRNRYRYASHGLRFDLNNPNENQDEFHKRINRQARNDGEGAPGTSSPSGHWVLGSQQRDEGSIHSDIWKGTGADLAKSNLIAIRPTMGWWRERNHLHQYNRTARYSLIVSVETPVTSVDIYTPVATRITTPVEIEIPT